MRWTYILQCLMFDGQFITQNKKMSIQLINSEVIPLDDSEKRRQNQKRRDDNNIIQYIWQAYQSMIGYFGIKVKKNFLFQAS